ncbi:uncharacterized protein EAE97_002709 [Botrytis byssoidea]|uniref:Uncharacterized protein n=1 Tax=Botrytis byssoidea TaxID=139641 RepID=A0A9P5IRN9_9HELO|nr:uncharacterized protein EAE97_002709 [Botrytis byssoidea]KAF7951158.1 hypothetical protein EAE97_002709 [Botrytis byssoidea]
MDTEMTNKQESTVVKTPAEGKEEALIPVIMHGPRPLQYKSKVPYDFNYYGDFYFASSNHRRERVKEIRSAKLGTAYDNSGEMGDRIVVYQRLTPFRFMDLPAEVRKIIFQLIASIFLYFDPKLKAHVNRIALGRYDPWRVHYQSCYSTGFEEFLKEEYHSKHHFSPEEKAKLYPEFVKGANDIVWTHKDHPNRNENYLQIVDVGEPLNNDEHKSQERVHWKYLDWFRKLANVSRQFRLELGFIIWERSKIYCRGDKKILVLGQFLEASPGITKGIRELVVSIFQLVEHWDDTSVEDEWDYIMREGNFMEVVSQNLNLDYLTLSISGPKSSIIELAVGKGVMKVLTETRALKVTKGFHIEISSIHPENNDGNETARKLAEFRIEWEPKITAALLPDVLRPQTPKTDRNHYLESRAKQKNKRSALSTREDCYPMFGLWLGTNEVIGSR